MTSAAPPAPDARTPDPADTRTRIEDALVELIADGDRLNHDGVAERAGVSRRTLYRYFPDREALMQAVGERVRSLAGPNVRFPNSEAELLSTLQPIYEGLDAIAPIATLVRSTPQGRATRLSDKDRRVRAYTKAAADAVKALPPRDRRLATAMLQFLHTSAWLELRDQWDMPGTDIAEACSWAMRTLLADLHKRGAKPLADGPAEVASGDPLG